MSEFVLFTRMDGTDILLRAKTIDSVDVEDGVVRIHTDGRFWCVSGTFDDIVEIIRHAAKPVAWFRPTYAMPSWR